jgi:hypothetical protein
MLNRKPIRRFAVPVVLLLLLVVGMTLCNVSHHHTGSSDTNCSICHVNHQAVDQPILNDSSTTLAETGASFEPQEPGFAPSPLAPRLPGRAPPTA